jgi:hypothetical protein
MKIVVTTVTFLAAACAQADGQAQLDAPAYAASVAIAAGMPGAPPDGLTIVANAVDVYPEQIANCGAQYLREIPTSDGIATFAFRVEDDQRNAVMSCLRTKLPGLIDIQPAPL